MAEYHRFVSYVYAYENNLKTRNSGFARVETRDRQCFIYLHMKEMYGGSHTIYRVYLFKRAEDGITAIYSGNIRQCQNQGDFECRITKDNIMDSGISLNEIAGIVVLGDCGRKFGTCWDDEPIDMSMFDQMKDDGSRVISLNKNLVPQIAVQMEGKQEETEKDEEPEEIIKETEIDTEKKTEFQDEAVRAVETVKEIGSEEIRNEISDEKQENKEENKQDEKPVYTEVYARKRELTIEERLGKMMAHGIKMQMPEDTEIDRCIRMEIQDIGMMPMKFWIYAGNSFVLQHYYSYSHLILARKKDGSYILGIPGMNEPKDSFMAQIFGFDRFKAVDENQENAFNGNFGYWYVELT